MGRNLSRINNYYQRNQAWADWEYVAAKARRGGYGGLVEQHKPISSASVSMIDRGIAALRAEFGWPEVYKLREQDAAGNTRGEHAP